MSLGPNAVLPCGTDSRRRTHFALGELCPVCEPQVEWTGVCPHCFRRVLMIGRLVQPHQIGGPGQAVKRQECRGNGAELDPPTPIRRPLSLSPDVVRGRRQSIAALRVLDRGGVA